MTEPLRYLSLFSGIGGFDLGFDRAGMVCAGQVEYDEKTRAVLAKHWPDVKRMNDVREVQGDEFGTVDLICGGFPCQDVSVAGRREGLAGERSGLWYEFHRLIEATLPPWIVIENVPGLLSSNGGKDIQIIIDSLTRMGYTVDIDIKDAQEFGVAQRRRRVFLTCVRLDDLLQKKTNLSRQVSADLLAQTLLGIWGAIPPASSRVPLRSVYEKPIERCVASLNRMTDLLRITRERLASKKYPDGLTVLLDQFGGAENGWACGSTARNERQGPQLLDKDTYEFLLKPTAGVNGDSSIPMLLSSALADVCGPGSKSTISTSTQAITEQRIFTFAKAALHTIALMLHSLDWPSSCWNVAQSVSTLLQENMNYARQASRHLFIESGLRNDWRDYLSSASRIEAELERHIGAIRAAEILFEREGGAGDITPGRGQRPDVAATVAAGAGSRRNGGSYPTPGQWVTHALTANANDNDAQGGHWVMAFTERTRADGRNLETLEDMAYALTNPGGGGRTQDRQIAGSFGVRRLTPVECERLQGFPIKEESIIIEVCTDPQKTFAHVGILSHKLPKLAGSAGKNKWFERARYAVRSLNQSAQSGSELVLNDVLIFCGERQVEIHSRGKCYLSVNFADGKNSFPPLMQSGDFALLVAGLNTIAARIIRTGKAESLVNAPALTHLQNGEQPAVRYGSVTIPLANVAEFDSTARSGLLKSITSNPSDTPINERTLITLYSSVLSAISGHIPNETLFTNSPRIEIASSFGWTFPQSDSPRYRQLGNAVAVPVAEWLGRRIVAAEMEVNPQ